MPARIPARHTRTKPAPSTPANFTPPWAIRRGLVNFFCFCGQWEAPTLTPADRVQKKLDRRSYAFLCRCLDGHFFVCGIRFTPSQRGVEKAGVALIEGVEPFRCKTPRALARALGPSLNKNVLRALDALPPLRDGEVTLETSEEWLQ